MSNDASVSSANFDTENDADSECLSPTMKHQNLIPTQTKVYYYFDKEDTPYATIIDLPPNKLTLGHFKTKLARTNFKYYNYRPDNDGMDIKFEVKDDSEILLPSSKGVITIYLLTDEQAISITSEPIIPQPPIISMRSSFNQNNHHLSNRFSQYNNKNLKNQQILSRRCGSFRKLLPFDDTARDDTNFYIDSRARAFSDDESLLTDFTSVSQQKVRRRRTKKKYNHRRMSPSFMSTTFSDASLCIDLVTVSFDLNTPIPLGLTIHTQSTPRGEDSGIYVSEIAPGSLVARDGRIKPGMMILEVNDIQLAEMTTEQAVNYLKESVNHRNGTIKLTCAQTEKDRFVLPDETVLPINTGAWVHQTMAMKNKFPTIVEDFEPRSPNANLVFNPNYLNAGGFPSSGVGTSICSESSFVPITNDTIHYKQLNHKMFKQQDKAKIANAMANSCGGLIESKHKIGNKKVFAASHIFDWLRANVEGLEGTKKCEKFASELVKSGFIVQVVNSGFSRETYYTFTDKTLNNRKILTSVNGQKPAMDETLIHTSSHKGLTYKLRNLLCFKPKNQSTSSIVNPPSAIRPPTDPIHGNNENIVPTNIHGHGNIPHHQQQHQQNYQNHYYSTARQYPSTHIP